MTRLLASFVIGCITLMPSPSGASEPAGVVSVSGTAVDATFLLLFGVRWPAGGVEVSVLQAPAIRSKVGPDGSFRLDGVAANARINLMVEGDGFARSVSRDIAVGAGHVTGITTYGVRTIATQVAGAVLALMTGVVLDPTRGLQVDPTLGSIAGIVIDAGSQEAVAGASIEVTGSGAVGAEIRRLKEQDKVTLTGPSVGYPLGKGAFFISNVPVGEQISLQPKHTGSEVTKARYEFAPIDVASVAGATTFVVIEGREIFHSTHPSLGAESIAFTEVSQAVGLNFQETTQLPLFNEFLYALGPGLTVNDFDNDGLPDLYVANGLGFPNRLFRNRGRGSFQDVTERAGVGDRRESGGVAGGDIDNDGCLDLYVGNATRNTLYRNNCDGTFRDITVSAGVGDARNARSVTFVDYDNDGFLDIFVSNYDLQRNVDFLRNDNPGQGNVLYRNNGDRTFTDVTQQAGIGRTGLAFAQTFTDYDNDGDQDLFVVHDSGRIVLYRNDGQGHFADVSRAAGFTATGSWMCASAADYDNDGFVDFFVTNVGHTTGLFVPILPGRISNPLHALYHNNGDGTFTDVASEAGVADGGFGWGCEWGDVDNDGNLDLYLVNNYYLMGVGAGSDPSVYGWLPPGGMGGADGFLFMNNGNGTFRDATKGTGISNPHDARGTTMADYDGDGFLDIFVANERGPLQVFRNSGNRNHWLKVRAVGGRSNRSAIGARVTISSGGLVQVREVSGGSSYKSQASLEVEFGLGSSSVVDFLEIRYPSGEVVTRRNVRADRLVVVEESRH